MRLTLRALLLTAVLAPIGCSSLGGIELGNEGPDRFPDDEDDGYGPSSGSASGSASTDTAGPTEASTTGGGSSEVTGDTEGVDLDPEDTGTGGTGETEGSEEAGFGDGSSSGDPSGLPPPGETSDSPDDGGTSSDGTTGECPELPPPPCPLPCEVELGGALPCGLDCTDEGEQCGDGYGAGMTCEDGVWVCFEPPARPDPCAVACDPLG